MKTTSLYPIIVTENVQETVDFYTGTLDYTVKHKVTRGPICMVILENPKGCTIEVMQKPEKELLNMKLNAGLHGFRMNVDDMDEAFAEFTAKGAKIIIQPTATTVGKNMVVCDPNGVLITVIEHQK